MLMFLKFSNFNIKDTIRNYEYGQRETKVVDR